MNIDELWNKYADAPKQWQPTSRRLMQKENFTEAIAEIISSPVEPEVKVQIAEKIKEVIQEKKNNIEEAVRNDDRYMKQCFDSELESIEDLLERLQASNLSA